jgi:hypothetical protein
LPQGSQDEFPPLALWRLVGMIPVPVRPSVVAVQQVAQASAVTQQQFERRGRVARVESTNEVR